jgi:NDP-sugar pyrophosphorylase family protein
MKAMLLAAGKGTRLQPLTNTKPKALIEVDGQPLLQIIIKRLIHFGFKDIVINVHHFAEQIYEFLDDNKNFGVNITISDEQDLLLDTGGGLLKAKSLLLDGSPILVHNVDIITNLNLKDLYDFHCQSKAIATMAVKDRNTSRSLLINKEGDLCGWRNNVTGELKHARGNINELTPIAFSAVHVMSPEIFEHITETGVFSIMDVYLRLAKTHKIATFNHNSDYWLDLGRIENIEEAANFLKLNRNDK